MDGQGSLVHLAFRLVARCIDKDCRLVGLPASEESSGSNPVAPEVLLASRSAPGRQNRDRRRPLLDHRLVLDPAGAEL